MISAVRDGEWHVEYGKRFPMHDALKRAAATIARDRAVTTPCHRLEIRVSGGSEDCYNARRVLAAVTELARAPESPIRSKTNGSVLGGDKVTLVVLSRS